MTRAKKSTTDSALYVLSICGSFRLTGPAGDMTVRSAKGRAILALLATGPEYTRTRAWLAKCLWSLSDSSRALSSLRGELLRLRALTGGGKGFLEVTRDSVALRSDRVRVTKDGGELLEGIRILGSPAFDMWLRSARAARPSTPPASVRATGEAPATIPVGGSPSTILSIGIAPPHCPFQTENNVRGSVTSLLSNLGHGLREIGGIDIIDLRGGPGEVSPASVPDVYLQCALNGQEHFTLNAVRSSDRRVVWSQACRLDGADANSADDLAERFLAYLSIKPDLFSDGRHLAVTRALTGIEYMFSLSADNLAAADACFSEAIEMHDVSSFHAWRAYLSAFWMEQRDTTEQDELREIARRESDIAMRLDPTNGLSLSLLSHVHAFVLRDIEKAGDLIERARALCSDNVMAHDAQALLKLYSGDPVGARRHAMKAAMFGRFLSYRYAFVTTLGMISAMTGEYEAGIRYGRLALSLQPQGKARPYPPALRYLGACLAQAGRAHEARETFSRLASVEPNLSPRLVGTADYPVPSASAAALIRNSLVRAGF